MAEWFKAAGCKLVEFVFIEGSNPSLPRTFMGPSLGGIGRHDRLKIYSS